MTNALFICEECGEISQDTCCEHCPIGGHGYTVAEIKEAFEKCPTVADVNDTAKHFREHVEALQRAGGGAAVMAIHIRNMARYKRLTIGKAWREA